MSSNTALQSRQIHGRDVKARLGAQDQHQEPASQYSPQFILEPSSGWMDLNLGDLWEYRELLYFLVWRDIKVRYKQTVLGIAWAVLQPFLTMVVFSVFFGKLGGIPSDNIPYPLFTYAALLPWQLFASSLSISTNSLVINRELITRIYFPRLIIPLSAVFPGVVDFSIAFVMLLPMMFYYGISPTVAILALPLLVSLALATALSVGLWLSALNVQYRDVQYTIPFLTQLWLFATPIAYPTSLIPENWRALYGLNPMVGVVEGFRWALLDCTRPLDLSIVASSFATIAILAGGLVYFKHAEKAFADIV